MTREGAEIIRGAMRAISEQCMKTDSCKNCPFPISVSAWIICLSVDLTCGLGRWFK